MERIAQGFRIFTIKLSKFLITINMISIFLMMLMISLEVVLRYTFHTSLIWPSEVTEYMMVGITFLGLAYVQYKDKHIKIDFVFNRFSPRTKVLVNTVNALAALFIFILVFITGWDLAWQAWTENTRSWTIMRIPLFPVRVTVPMGGLVMCLYLISEITQNTMTLLRKHVNADGNTSQNGS